MDTTFKPFRSAVDAVAFCCMSVVVACAFGEVAETRMTGAAGAVSEIAQPLDAEPDA